MKTLGIGMVGYGFIGKVHTLSYLNLPYYYKPMPARLKMVGVASVPVSDAEEGVEQAGFEFATDGHWNETGHALVAESIGDSKLFISLFRN